jgi:hypothetical protein
MANAGNPQASVAPQGYQAQGMGGGTQPQGYQTQGMGGGTKPQGMYSLGRDGRPQMTPMPEGGWSPEQMEQTSPERSMMNGGSYSNAQSQMNGFNNQTQNQGMMPQPMHGAEQPKVSDHTMMPQPPKGWLESLTPYSPTGIDASPDGFMTEHPGMRGFDYSKGVYKDGYGPIRAFVETQQPQILQSPQGQTIQDITRENRIQGMYSLGRDGRPQIDSSLPSKPLQPIPQGGQPNVYQQSAGAYNQALDATANPTMGIDVQNYFNPYESQVVDNTLNDLERSRQMATNQMDYNAGRAGAFGGSRHGIAQAETNTGYAREAANAAAQLRNYGYENAQNFALRDASTGLEQGRQFGSLANMGFGFGQDIQKQQSQQGLQQQLTNQALIDAAKQQYSGYTGSPYNSLNAFGNVLGISNMNQGTNTKTQNTGLFDYLSLAANLYGG